MAYLKFSADRIFTGTGFVEGKVLVTDTSGRVEAIVPSAEAGEGVAFFPGILSPGFINCHCHLELSYLKDAIPEATGLYGFVQRVMQLRQRPEPEIQQAITLGEREMYQNGIVAVGDICNTAHTISCKQKSGLAFFNFVEIAGFLPGQAAARMAHAKALFEQFSAIGKASVVPHAPYSVSDILMEDINAFSAGKTISIHNEETADENLFFREKKGAFLRLYANMHADISFFKPSGKSSLQTYLPRLASPSALLLVHNTYASQADIAFAIHQAERNHQQLYWTLCPQANWYIERKMPPLDLLLQANAALTLGTDSLASNHQLSILSEISLLQEHFPSIPPASFLQWATLNGARALGLDKQLGSLEKGKKPGILQLDESLHRVKRLL